MDGHSNLGGFMATFKKTVQLSGKPVCLFVCSLLLAVAGRADGPWYVAVDGVDDTERNGLSWEQAWQSIGYAVGEATEGTIFVSNGVYKLNGQIAITKPLVIEGVAGRENTIVDAQQNGRCFHLNNTAAVLRGLTLTNGFATSTGGGGVYLQRGLVEKCDIAGNIATNLMGGGIHIYNNAVGTTNYVYDCRIYGNIARVGGGILVYDGYSGSYRTSAVIEGCQIFNNIASLPGDWTESGEPGGGGVWYQGKDLVMRDCKVYNNLATANDNPNKSARGGGFSSHNVHKTALLENCEFVGNTVSNAYNVCSGGGLHFSGGGHVLRNCLVARNRTRRRGAGILTDRADTTNLIESCTIVDNESEVNTGSGISFDLNGFDEVWNSVVYSNKGTHNWYFGNNARTNYIHYTCTPAMTGRGNVTEEPRFVDFAGGDYRMKPSSPTVNAGTIKDWMAQAVDLDGNARLDKVTGRPDMGCYELVYTGSVLLLR